MRVPVRLIAALAVSLSAATASGQGSFFAPGPTRSWTFSGCASESLVRPGPIVYCVDGLLAGGRNARAVTQPELSPFVWQLTLSTGGQHDGGDSQWVRGTGVGGAPVAFSFDWLSGGTPNTFRLSEGPDPWAVDLTTASTILYNGRYQDGSLRFGYGTFALTEVTVTPEPSTYVLFGTGLAALGFIARRRRAA